MAAVNDAASNLTGTRQVRGRHILYYITDSSQLDSAGSLLDCIRRAYSAGVDWVQIREKQMPARRLYELARAAAALPEKRGAALLINERADIALAAAADGVHLPANSVPAHVVRRIAPEPFLIGVSCHTAEEAEQALLGGATFAVLGPVFPTPGKGAPIGLDALREACERLRSRNPKFPVLALGGITAGNAPACLAAGAAGIAAIRLFQSADVEESVRRIRQSPIRRP